MKHLPPRSPFIRGAACLVFVTAATAFAACTAEGALDLGPDEALDGSTADSEATPLPDAGSDAPVAPTTTCGNKTIDKGEECDDGNSASGDGCSAACSLESNGPADLCAGALVSLTKEDASTLYTGKVNAATTGLFNHYTSSCGGGTGADAVYRIEPPMTGRATARVSAAFAAILSVRTTCANDKTELGCAEVPPSGADAGANTELSFPVFQGAPVYLFVDGYGGSGGEFTLEVDVQTAVCGNGKAEFPEACDDGNTTSNDGCSSTCTVEDSATASACPGMGYRLTASSVAPGTVSFAGDTGALANGGGSATGCFSTGSGPNAIYAITPTVTGSIALSLLANYPNALLHVRRECAENATQADCTGTSDPLAPLATAIPVTAEQTVYVFVDSGGTSSKGLFTLDATLTAAVCGNGKLDGGEECDDGATTDGDGCSATCTVERDAATYTCPGKALRLEGATPAPRSLSLRGTTAPLAGQTLPASKWSSCGAQVADVVYQVTTDVDGWLTAKVKGAFNAAVAVRAACATGTDLACAKAAGGNGEEVLGVAVNKETPYFVVVDGATAGQLGAFTLDLTVTPSVCGNSIIEGGETCDDGATSDGDGCSAACKVEPPSPHDSCGTAPLMALEEKAGGNWAATIVSGNTNFTKVVANEHSLSPCSSWWADGWYPFTAPISGVMTARIASATFRSTIAVRTGCSPTGAQLMCDGENAKGGQEIVFPVDQGTTYWVAIAGGVVVSNKPEIGRFTLDMNLVPIGCGDTFLNAPEACDDGNLKGGDGCSSTCALEPLAGIDSCPGHAVTLTGTGSDPRRATVTVGTNGLPSKTGSMCGGSGPEGVLVNTPDVDGQLSIRATATYAVVVHARTTCGDPATEIPKSSCSSTNLQTVSTAVTKNTPYYVFVDGQNGSTGVAKLQITVTP